MAAATLPRLLPPAVLLMGPTASGKTALALELARRFPLELVSVDSAQVFRDMNIGTAKPDAATLAAVPHHLIDLISPQEAYSAARFQRDALAVMGAITGRGKVPLLVGGTMLYFKALLEGLADLPAADLALRRELDCQASERGWPALHAELAAVDPLTAARLQAGDGQRIQRALEVFRLTGQPLSALLASAHGQRPPYSMLSIGLLPADRGELHRRIAERFDAMLAAGLVAEVRRLRHKYVLHAQMPSMRCVGSPIRCDRKHLTAAQTIWRRTSPAWSIAFLLEAASASTPDDQFQQLVFTRGSVLRAHFHQGMHEATFEQQITGQRPTATPEHPQRRQA